MQSKDKEDAKGKRQLAKIVGSQTVVVDGNEVMVPNGAAENAAANRVLASQMRAVMQRSIKDLYDRDLIPTPKEMRDMAEAAKAIAQFSGEVYKPMTEENGSISRPGEKVVEPAGEEIDLDGIKAS